VDQPDYAALIVRRNYPDLVQPGGLVDMSHDWLDGTAAKWNEQFKKWHFPGGACLQFGHMDNKTEIKRYKGGQYQTICIDEMTDFNKTEAMFLHSRLRRRTGSTIPLRFRAASNPGGTGHEWVKARYVDYDGSDRLFIPATLDDNPYIDRAAYVRSLDRLDPITRERLLKGDWTVTDGGRIFDRSWFANFYDARPELVSARVRAWDLAATVHDASKETAGVLMSRTVKGLWAVEHVVHGKWLPGDRDRVIRQTAETDGEYTSVVIEEEPGSGGKAQNENLIRMLAGFRVESIKVTGDKFVRAGAFASQCQAGNVFLVRGPWNAAYIDQLHAADPENDELLIDMMDASSLGFNALVRKPLNPYAVETPERTAKRSLGLDLDWERAEEEEAAEAAKARKVNLYERMFADTGSSFREWFL